MQVPSLGTGPPINEAGALADVRQHYRGEVLLAPNLLVIE